MERKNFNEVLKAKEREQRDKAAEASKEIALDDTQRVKVLSPGRLVFNRFVRNKLAIAGSIILLTMFTFAFLAPLFYSYSQTEIFYKYDGLNIDYASVSERTSYTNYIVDEDAQIHYSVQNMITSYVNEMEESGETQREITDPDSGEIYYLDKLGDKVYQLSGVLTVTEGTLSGITQPAKLNKASEAFMYNGDYTAPAGFETACLAAIANGENSFVAGGNTYLISEANKKFYNISDTSEATLVLTDGTEAPEDMLAALLGNIDADFAYGDMQYFAKSNADGTVSLISHAAAQPLIVSSLFVFDAYEDRYQFSDEFKAAALLDMYKDGSFSYDGTDYTVANQDGEFIVKSGDTNVAALSTFSVRRYSGEDTLPIDFKNAAREVVEGMIARTEPTAVFNYELPRLTAEGVYEVDENGNLTYEDTEITVTRKEGQFVLNCAQTTYLIDIYAPPSREHIFGTDADGMDILARMMYGGRISLMVGFVVVIIETLLGVILGGIAGYFGGWVDTLIMRLVDIFYCIPSMPILIILGSMFDELKLGPYQRLLWMMAVLGFLGWAGVARMVRGQILSLREQEFMTAAEATGLSVSRRIFKHLVPNVMPQLIVTATMGLGSVIITESTLSFLGLGVKHPLATWGTMINSITSSNENMVRYAYIWIPVGALICLTVIAFNFVGDGLRDAFDPKMK